MHSPRHRTARVVAGLALLAVLGGSAASSRSASRDAAEPSRGPSAPAATAPATTAPATTVPSEPAAPPTEPGARAAALATRLTDEDLVGQVLMPYAYGSSATNVSAGSAAETGGWPAWPRPRR